MTPVPVLWLIKGLGRGGAERLVSVMAPRIDRQRFALEVAYLLPSEEGFADSLRQAGITTTCLDARRSIDTVWPRRLRSLLRERRYAIVHTHSPLPAVAARRMAPPSSMLVHTEHNLWGVYRWPTFAGNALTFGRNEAVFAVSDGVAASIQRPWWTRVGSEPPVETLLHGVDAEGAPRGEEARRQARARLDLDLATPVIGNVANLSPKKDHHSLLVAVEEVRRHVPDVVLLLIGSGPLEQQLRSEVASRGLAETVRFLGSRDDVAELLPAFDVFTLSSRFEGLPISLLEAMAAEVACVATAVGGIPEVIDDGVHGRVVPPGAPAELAHAITVLLTDPARRRSVAVAGCQRVAAGFSIDRAIERTEGLYDELVTRQRGDSDGNPAS